MSFILDALKKSETERQQQGSSEFSGVPVSTGSTGAPKWLWIVGGLLALNALVLSFILLRPDSAPVHPDPSNSTGAVITSESERVASAPVINTAKVPESSSPELTFEQQIATAKQNQVRQDPPATTETELSGPTARSEPSSRPVSTNYVRSFDEARVQGLIQMVDLHLDIHVFGETPADRFVFINMVKHREGSRLSEGPTVNEIRPDGVILEYQGTTFLLPRD
jgi:general secretion pathway protein B